MRVGPHPTRFSLGPQALSCKHRQQAPHGNRRPVREPARGRCRTNVLPCSAWSRNESPRAGERGSKALPPDRYREGHDPAGYRCERERCNDRAGSNHGAHSGHQLHVSRAGGAERMSRHHQREPKSESSHRSQERYAARSGCRESNPDAGHCGRQRVRDAAGANVDHRRGQREGRKGYERRIRNCSQSPSRTRW